MTLYYVDGVRRSTTLAGAGEIRASTSTVLNSLLDELAMMFSILLRSQSHLNWRVLADLECRESLGILHCQLPGGLTCL